MWARGIAAAGWETRTRPTACSSAWQRLRWSADLRFRLTVRARSCPLRSPTCRLPVYPTCTQPPVPSGRGPSSVLRSSATGDRSAGRHRDTSCERIGAPRNVSAVTWATVKRLAHEGQPVTEDTPSLR
jgi:hypothetical protein